MIQQPHKTSARKNRWWIHKAVKPLAMALAAAIGFTGLSLFQTWMDSQSAQAADGTVDWKKPDNGLGWNFTEDAVYGVGSSVRPDANGTVWEVKNPNSSNPTVDKHVNDTTGGIYGPTRYGGWDTGQTTTLAIGPAMELPGEPLAGWHWGYAGNIIKRVVPGSNQAIEFVAPAGDGWSGGESIQGTGEIFFGGLWANTIRNDGRGTFKMMVCDPTKYTKSGSQPTRTLSTTAPAGDPACVMASGLAPATPADKLTPGRDTDTWSIASDMALDAEGNAYILVGAADKYILKVTRGANNQLWKWQKVLQLRPLGGPAGLGGALTSAEYNAIGGAFGMAFADGKFFVHTGSGSTIGMIDPLTRYYSRAWWNYPNTDIRDFASISTAANIRGRVYIDQDGNGVISEDQQADEDNAAVGLKVELYDASPSGQVYTTQTDGTGEYNFLINNTNNADWYIRLPQPQLDGYNARQTWAAGGPVKLARDGSMAPGTQNSVTTRCSGVEATATPDGVACFGARLDGIDPSSGVTPANVFTDTGGQIVAKVNVKTAKEVSVVDFGISVAGSYGDAPASFKATRAQGGPVAYAPTSQGEVYLGETPGLYPDGVNELAAASHVSDNGLEVRDHGADDASWVLAQDQILVVGRSYDFRAQLSGEDAADGFVKAWFAELAPGGAASTTFNNLAMGATVPEATPEGDGYVYLSDYQVPATLPTGGLQNMFVRVRAGLEVGLNHAIVDQAKADPAPGNAAWDTQPWVQAGEVEDYRMAVAPGTVKLQARTLGGVGANFAYDLSNVTGTAPSAATAAITTNASGDWQPSPQAHAFAATGTAIAITTQSMPQGWRLSQRVDEASQPIDTYCFDPATGDLVDHTVSGSGQLTLAATAVVTGASLVCRLTYVPQIDLALTTLSTSPTPDSGDPLTVDLPAIPGETYTLTATLKGQVEDQDSELQTVAVPGETVTMDIAPVTASGATASGAHFTPGSSQNATCQTDDLGECSLEVAATVSGTYTVTASANVAGSATAFTTEATPGANRHPAELYYKAGPVTDGWMRLDDTQDQQANYGVTGEEPYDSYTLELYLTDGTNPVDGQAAAVDLTLPAGVVVPDGVAADSEGGPGRYLATVYATKAGAHQLGAAVGDVTLLAQGSENDYVTATFTAMNRPCLPGSDSCDSSFTIDNTGTKVADGVDTRQGQLTLVDANGNPLSGQDTKVSFEVTKGGTTVPPSDYAISLVEDSRSGHSGEYSFTMTSTVAGDLEVTATFDAGVSATEVELGQRTASFVPGGVGGESSLSITDTADQVADHGSTEVLAANWGKYQATIYLEDTFGNPITDGAAMLTMSAAEAGPVFAPATGVECAQTPVGGQCLSGQYTVMVYSTKAGAKSISATYDLTGAAPVTLGPATATFVVGPADPVASSLLVTPAGPVEADGTQVYTAKAVIRDFNQNLVASQPVRFTLEAVTASGATATGATMQAGATTDHATLTVNSSGSGVASLTITATVVGNYDLAAFLGEDTTDITNSPVTLEFVTGAVSLSASDYEVSTTPIVANGLDSGTVTVRLVDNAAHPLSGLADELRGSGPAGQGVTVGAFTETATAGTYTAAVSGTKSGVKLIAVHWNPDWEGGGPGSALLVKASASDSATFVAGPPDLDKSSAVINPTVAISPSHPQVVADGSDSYTITVTLVDANSNPVTDWYSATAGLSNYLVSASPAGASLSASPTQNTPGVYTVKVTSSQIENYLVDVAYGTSTSSLVIAEDLAANFSYGWPVVTSGTLAIDAGPKEAGNPSSYYTVTVKLVDSAGHKVTDGTSPGKLVLSLTGANAGNATLSALTQSGSDPSVYTVQVTASQPDGYTVAATYAGQALGAVTAVFGNPTPDPAKSYFLVSTDPVVANGTDYGTVTIYLNNSSDLPVDVATSTLSAAATPMGVVGAWSRQDAGVYQAKVTATLAGVKTVTANQSTIGPLSAGAGNTITFVPGPVDPTKTLASLETQGGQARTSGADPRWARMMVQDAYANPIGGEEVCFQLDYSGGDGPLWGHATTGSKEACATSSSATGTLGYATVTALSYFEGSFDVRGKVDSTVGTGTKPIVFARDTGHPDHSEWTIEQTDTAASEVVANGSDSYTATITIRNQSDEPVFAAGGSLAITPTGPAQDPSGGFTTTFDGTAEVVVTSTISGQFTVRAYIGDDEIGSAKTITFVPGPVSDLTSTLTSPATPAVADGVATQVIRAEVRDAYGVAGAGNLITGAAVSFAIPAGVSAKISGEADVVGPDTVVVTTGTSGSTRGVARLTLVSTVADSYLVTAAVGATAITIGSPASAVFINGPADPATSVLVVPTAGTDKQVRNETHRAQVTVNDAFGNLVTDQPVDVTISWRATVPGTGPWSTAVVSTVMGVATHDFTVQVAGDYQIRATLAGTAVQDSPQTVTFVHGPASAPDSTLVVSSGLVANNGTAKHTATVTVLDAPGGNRVSGASVDFSVSGSALMYAGPTETLCADPCTVVTSASGVAQIKLSDLEEETVTVTATIDTVEVNQSPSTVDFGPSEADPETSSWVVEPTTAIDTSHPYVVADGTDSFTVTVTVRDSFSSVVGGMPVGFQLPSAIQVSPVGPWLSEESGSDKGTVQVLFTATQSGTYEVSALLGGVEIDGSPQYITFGHGEIDPVVSYLVAPAGSVVANGVATQTVTAYVLDAHGNPVDDAEVIFAVPAGTTVQGKSSGLTSHTVPVEPDTGAASLVLLSEVAGTYLVTAAAVGEGDPIDIETDSPASVVFTHGAYDPATSIIEVLEAGPKVADGVAYYTVKVSLRDAKGNAVTAAAGQNVAFDFALDAATAQFTAAVNASGVATYQYATTKAGVWQASASFGGSAVLGGDPPLDLDFVAGEFSPEHSTFTVSTSQVLANGIQRHWGKVQLFDAFLNPVSGQDVTFEVLASGSGVPGPFTNAVAGPVTVQSCDPADGSAPDWCTVDEVFQPGLAYVQFTSDEPGTFDVTATSDGQRIPEASATRQISFTAGLPNAAKSSWALEPDTATPSVSLLADGTTAYELTATIMSHAEVLVDSAAVRLNLRGASANLLVDGLVGEDTSALTGTPTAPVWGEHTWLIASNAKGSFEFDVQVHNGSEWVNVGAPVVVRFNAGLPVAANSWLVEPADPAAAGTDSLTVTAQVRDANGLLVDDGHTVVFTVPTALSPSGEVAVLTADGRASVVLSSLTAGTFDVTAEVSSEPIMVVRTGTNPAVTRSDGNAKLTWQAGLPSAAHSVLTIPTAGSEVVANGLDQHTAQVQVMDQTGNNPVSGVSVTFTHGWDESNITVVNAVSDASGIATISFTSTKAASHTVTASLDGAPVQDSPAAAVFVAGPLDPTATLATLRTQGGTALASGYQPLWAQMTAVDQYSNPVSGETLNFLLPYSGTQGPVFAPLATGGKTASGLSGADGRVRVNLVSTWQGTFEVKGKIGAATSGLPMRTVTFDNDAGDPNLSAWSVAAAATNPGPGIVVANGSDHYTASVTIANALGQPLNGVGGTLTVTSIATGASRVIGFVTGHDGPTGLALVDIDSLDAGQFAVSVQLGGDPVATTVGGTVFTQLIEFVAGPPCELNSHLVPPTAPALADGEDTQVIQAKVRDAYGSTGTGNPVGGVDVTFSLPPGVTAAVGLLSIDGPAEVTIATGTSGTELGVASLVLTSTVKGNYDVTARVGTMHIDFGTPATARFVAGPPDLGSSTFSITTADLDKPVRTDYHNLLVQVRDAQGNLVDNQSVTVAFRWRLSGSTGPWSVPAQVVTTSGLASHDFTVELAGTYVVEAYLVDYGQVSPAKLASFVAGPASPADSLFASSSGVRVPNNGVDSHWASVQVLDGPEGNPVGGEPVTFTVSGSADLWVAGTPCGQSCTVISSAAGMAEVTVVNTSAQTVTVTAIVAESKVGAAPLEFGPGGPVAANSEWVVEATTPIDGSHPAVVADGADSYTATVTVRDAGNLVVPGAAVTFNLPSGVDIAPASGPYLTDPAGQVQVTFTSTTATSFPVRARVGAYVAPNPEWITFAAGPIDDPSSFLEEPTAAAQADGVDTKPVLAHIQDRFGNPIADATVRFTVPPGTYVQGYETEDLTEIDVPVDPGTGVAALYLVSTVADTYEVTAEAWRPAGTAVEIVSGSPAQVRFVPGPVDAAHSRLWQVQPGPMVADGAQFYTVKAQLFDAFDNPVKQAGVVVTFRFALGSQVVARSAVTDANGVASYDYATTKAGVWQGTGRLYGASIAVGSPLSLAFVPGTVDPDRSTFWTSESSVLADGEKYHWAKAQLVDYYGNPVGGEPVDFAVSLGLSGAPAPWFGSNQVDQTLTVTTCDPADEPGAPEWCTVEGLFQTGLAYVELRSTQPGTFDVTAQYDAAPIEVPARQVSFTAGKPDPSLSAYVLTPDTAGNPTVNRLASGELADAYSLVVSVFSAAGLPVDDAQVRLTGLPDEVMVTPAVSGATALPGSAAFGTFTWELTTEVAGVYTGTVEVLTDDGYQTVGATFLLRFVSGDPVAAASWLEGPSLEATAGATARQTVTAKVNDLLGNPADHGEVVFHVPTTVGADGLPALTPSGDQVVSVVDGLASLDLASLDAGTFEITASVRATEDDPLEAILSVKPAGATAVTANTRSDGIVPVTFTAGPVDQTASYLTVPTAVGGQAKVADGVEYHTALVQALDATGRNAVKDVRVRFQWISGTATAPDTGTWQTISPDVTTGGSGTASYDHISTRSGWVWFKAFVKDGDGNWVQISGSPAKAKFVADEVDVPATLASLETFDQPVLNNLLDASWARLVVQDVRGNGVPGVPVTFTLPAGGSTVFRDGDGAPAGKSITVDSCDADVAADLANPACLVDGDFVEGLAKVDVISGDEGSFTVSAELDLGVLGPAAAGSGPVVFSAGAPSASASSFLLSRTVAAQPNVTANGDDSYTLSVTVMNAGSGASALPVSGVCVTPVLPAAVTVKSPAVGRGSCLAGQFETDAAGLVEVELVSTVAGSHLVGASIAAGSIPTVAGGSTYTRTAVYVGGPPVVGTGGSYLTSPVAASLADGLTAQTITATLVDEYGNAAECFDDAGLPEPCLVDFDLPSGIWAGQGAAKVTGPARIVVEAGTNAVAELSVYAEVSDTYLISAEVAGESITVADGVDNTPEPALASVSFFSGPADPKTRSYLSIPTAGVSGTDTVRVSSDGSTTHTAEVFIADAMGNPKADQAVRITWQPVGASGSSGLQMASVLTDASGVAQTQFASTWAGTYVVRAYLVLAEDWTDPVSGLSHLADDAVEVTDSPAMATFRAGPPSDSGFDTYLVAPAMPAAADGVASQTVTLVTADDLGNPASCDVDLVTGGCAVTWDTTSDAALASLITTARVGVDAELVTAADGQATITLTSLTAGRFSVGAKVGGFTLGASHDAPAEVVFQAGPAVAGQSQLTVSQTATNPEPGVVRANGYDTYTLVVEVNDANGNPTSSTDVYFYLTAGPGAPHAATNPVLQTLRAVNVDGQATVTLSATEVGQFYVWATLGARTVGAIDTNKVSGSPQAVVFTARVPDLTTSLVSAGRLFVEANRTDPAARGLVDSIAVYITLKDAAGETLNPSETAVYQDQVSVHWTEPGVEASDTGVAQWQADGRYLVTLTSSDAGDVLLDLVVDGDTAEAVLLIKFVPTPPAPVFDTMVQPVSQISGTAQTGLTVMVTDQGTGAAVCQAVAGAGGVWSCTPGSSLDGGVVLAAVAVRDETDTPSDLPAQHIFTSLSASTTIEALMAEISTVPQVPVPNPSNGVTLTGSVGAGDIGRADLWVVVSDPVTGAELCRQRPAVDGRFVCLFDPMLADGAKVKVRVEDDLGQTSPSVIVQIHAEAPTQPWVDPTDGKDVTGHGQPGDTITITDANGQQLCSTTVGADGRWRCRLQPPANEGDLISIVATNPAGVSSLPVIWRVGLPRMTLGHKELYVGDVQTGVGYNFQPGEAVTGTQFSDPYVVGVVKADLNGTVRFRYTVPPDTPAATHHFELAGAWSGKIREAFTVVQAHGPDGVEQQSGDHQVAAATNPAGQGPAGGLPFTGADLVPLLGAALAALLAGWVLWLLGRRGRNRDEQDASGQLEGV